MAKRPSTQFKPLTVIQEAYCQEYIKSPENQTQAAVNAGYSPKTSAKFASQNMRDERIQKRIAELMAERNTRTKMSADAVLMKLVEMVDADIGDILNDDGSIKPIRQWSPIWRRSVAAFDIIQVGDGVELKKVKLLDKVKILELIGKHVDVNAFRDRVELDVKMTIADRMAAARKRLKERQGGDQ